MKINLAPLKYSNRLLIKQLAEDLKRIFPVNIDIIELEIEMESSYSPERKQYHSTKILEAAISHTESFEGKVLLITEMDLFVPVLTFVFGEAQLNGKHSIISACRLHEEFYTGQTNNELLKDRIKKEALHELGHNFGLFHCPDWDCVMHSSNSIEEVDIKGNMYCPHCLMDIRDIGIQKQPGL